MSRPRLALADIFRQHGPDYRIQHPLPVSHLRVMRAIQTCRTATLGGHVETCSHCEHQRIVYNSCRNRHCPKCQSTAKERWIEQRKTELLPIPYFHAVFTVPPAVAEIALRNKKILFGILFRTSAETLLRIAADPKHLGAHIGFFSILHTWDRICSFIRMFIASSPAAAYRSVASAGYVAICRALLTGVRPSLLPAPGQLRVIDIVVKAVAQCPVCRIGVMSRILVLPPQLWRCRSPDSS